MMVKSMLLLANMACLLVIANSQRVTIDPLRNSTLKKLEPPVKVAEFDRIAKCDVLKRTDSVLIVQLQTHEHNFVVELGQIHHGLVASEAKHTANLNGKRVALDVSHHQWMSGRLRDHTDSTARMHIDKTDDDACDSLSGVFQIESGWFIVERQHGVLTVQHESATAMLERDFIGEGGCDAMHPSHSYEPANNNTTNRKRRATNEKGCSVFLDCDDRFFDEWKGDCVPGETSLECEVTQVERVTVKMIDALHMVDHIYRTDSVTKNLVELHVAGTYIHSTNFYAQYNTDSGVALDAYEAWLAPSGIPGAPRGEDVLRADQVCLNHLFTHSDFAGSTVGIAFTGGGSNNAGGVCGTKGRNSGMTSSLVSSGSAPQWYMVRIAAHEFGHNLGAGHDSTSACLASNWLMRSSVDNDIDSATGERLSSCSQVSIKNTIDALGTSASPLDNCFGVSDNPCDNGGECCIGNVLADQGTVCGQQDKLEVCRDAPVCDGLRPECPMGLMRDNDAPCDTDDAPHGVCHNGACSNVNTGYCDAFMASHGYGSQGGCSHADHECKRACLDTSDRCIEIGKDCGITGWNFGSIAPGGCPQAATNTPCTKNGADGLCNAAGACVACQGGTCGLNYGRIEFTHPPSPEWTASPTPSPSCEDSAYTGYTSNGAPITCERLVNYYNMACDSSMKRMCPVSCDACPTKAPTPAPPTPPEGVDVAPCYDTMDTGYESNGEPLSCTEIDDFCTDATYGAEVSIMCAETCKTCPIDCVDQSNSGHRNNAGAWIKCNELGSYGDLSCSSPRVGQRCPVTCAMCGAEARCGGSVCAQARARGRRKYV
eukprot:m.113704 g.113704  ORF g.113704 m.113704 type:complete len:825 (+) comp28292_c0_seq1:219-2693(+)